MYRIDKSINLLLVFFKVGEPHEGKLIANEGFGCRKGLNFSFILLYLIKITGVYVTAQLWNHRGCSWVENGGKNGSVCVFF